MALHKALKTVYYFMYGKYPEEHYDIVKIAYPMLVPK